MIKVNWQNNWENLLMRLNKYYFLGGGVVVGVGTGGLV